MRPLPEEHAQKDEEPPMVTHQNRGGPVLLNLHVSPTLKWKQSCPTPRSLQDVRTVSEVFHDP